MTGTGARLQVAFGINPFDNTNLDLEASWIDVNADVRSITYQTDHRSDRFAVFSAGNLTATLDNRIRRYDPDHATGPFFGQMKRYVPVRLIAVHAGVRYVKWYGYALEWRPQYAGKFDSVTVLQATTPTGVVARYEMAPIDPAAHAGDTAGGRIARVLDDMGHPSAYRSLEDDGQMQETKFGVNALAHIQQVARSVSGGSFYSQRDGTLTHDGQAALASTRQSVSQISLTHDGAGTGTVPIYQTIEVSGVGLGYRDLVRIGRTGGTVQTVDNSAANEAPIVFQQQGLHMSSDASALTVAEFYADAYGVETTVPSKVSFLMDAIDPTAEALISTAVFHLVPSHGPQGSLRYKPKPTVPSDATNNSQMMTLQLRDRITVNFNPPGGGGNLVRIVTIDGISGRIANGTWHETYTLSSWVGNELPISPDNWMLLDSATNGQLNANDSKLAY